MTVDKNITGYFYLALAILFSVAEYTINQYLFKEIDIFIFGLFHFWSVAIFITPFIIKKFGTTKIITTFNSKKLEIINATICITIVGIIWFSLIANYGSVFTSIMEKTEIIFSVILGYFLLKEKLNIKEIIGITLCFTGAMIVSFQNVQFNSKALALSLICFFTASTYSFLIRKNLYDIPSILFSFYRIWIIGLIYFVILLFKQNLYIPSTQIIITAFATGIIGTLGAGYCYIESLKFLSISTTSSLKTISPVFVMIAAYFAFNEIPNLQQIIGGLIIISGALLIVLFRQNHKKEVIENISLE